MNTNFMKFYLLTADYDVPGMILDTAILKLTFSNFIIDAIFGMVCEPL